MFSLRSITSTFLRTPLMASEHATVLQWPFYQRSEDQDPSIDVSIDPTIQGHSIKDLPDSLTSLMECPAPTSKPKCLVNANFSLSVKELPVEIRRQNAPWLIGRNSTRNQAEDPQAVEATDQPNTQPTKITSIPGWSAYNSLVSDPMPTTRVGTPPLVAVPAHEWSTLLTILMQAHAISVKVVGRARKTVISLEFGALPTRKETPNGMSNVKC